MTQKTLVNRFVITTFVLLYLCVSVISTIHVIDFFSMSNPYWLAVSLAIAFELGAAASLASLIALEKMNKGLVWALFITITLMQMQGNMYYAFKNLQDYKSWVELFNLIEEDPLYQKRILSFVSGAILPLVALGFIKSLVDYIKPTEEAPIAQQTITEQVEDMRKVVEAHDELEKEIEEYIESVPASDNIEETVAEVPVEDTAESILGLTVEEVPEESIEKYAQIIKNENDLNEYLKKRQEAKGLINGKAETRNVKSLDDERPTGFTGA